MDANAALIVAAAVTALGGILVAVIQQFRKENHTDHQVVLGMLKVLHKGQNRVEGKVERLDDRLTDHIESHPYERVLDNDRPIHQDGVEGNSKVS
jgi:hypothetical protein